MVLGFELNVNHIVLYCPQASVYRMYYRLARGFPQYRWAAPVFGGAGGIRTPDLRRAKAALSQLSYGPISGDGFSAVRVSCR